MAADTSRALPKSVLHPEAARLEVQSMAPRS